MNVNPQKNYFAIRLTDYQLFEHLSWRDRRYSRQILTRIFHPPTDEQRAEYERVKAAWEIVYSSDLFDSGCNCESPSVEEPTGRVEYVYAETEQEWLERCRQIRRAES